jgi:hypothetical protein
LGFDVIGAMRDSSGIFRAINYRHDCVHRNGFDKDGKKLDLFTKKYVQSVADEMREIVDGIEMHVRKQPGQPTPSARNKFV